MKEFTGFPSSGRTQYTPIPNVFFTGVLPEITDIAELKVTLFIFNVIYSKKGYVRFVTFNEMLGDKSLVNGLKSENKSTEERLRNALESATGRGTIIHLRLTADNGPEDVYFVNTEADRQVVAKITNGELALAGLKTSAVPEINTEPVPDIFTLYEQNIGMLTPMVAEWLKEAEKSYPEAWIRDAFAEAVSLNKRSWRYIDRILENWSVEGRGHGTYRGDSKKDSDKYARQKYGNIVKS